MRPSLLLISAVGFVVLALAATALYPSAPDASAGAEEVAAFYEGDAGRIAAVQSVFLLAGAFLITFVALLRSELARRTGGHALAAVVGAAGTAAVAVMMVAGSMDLIAASRADEQGGIEPATAAGLFDLGVGLFTRAAPVLWAPAVLAVAALSLREGAAARWFGLVSIPLAVVLLVPPTGLVGMILLHFWVLALAVLLSRRADPA